MSAPSDNARASLAMVAAMAGFVINDTVVKISAASLSAPQIMGVRGAMATLMLCAFALGRGRIGTLGLARHPAVLARAGADIGATVTYILALSHMPIANASAIFQALPLVITAAAAILLAEPVGPRRWAAIAVGFGGVLCVVRPGVEGFNASALLVLASVAFSAIRDLVTRRMPAAIPSVTVSAATALAVTATGLLLTPLGGWTPMAPGQVALLAGGALALVVGYLSMVAATRIGDLGFVAPFRYAILPFSILSGIVVFRETPDAATLFGSAVIVASGAYALYRERERRPAIAAEAQGR